MWFAVPVEGGTALIVGPSDELDAAAADETLDAEDAGGSTLECAEGAASSAVIGGGGVRNGL
jgi:hypothetical protein